MACLWKDSVRSVLPDCVVGGHFAHRSSLHLSSYPLGQSWKGVAWILAIMEDLQLNMDNQSLLP